MIDQPAAYVYHTYGTGVQEYKYLCLMVLDLKFWDFHYTDKQWTVVGQLATLMWNETASCHIRADVKSDWPL